MAAVCVEANRLTISGDSADGCSVCPGEDSVGAAWYPASV